MNLYGYVWNMPTRLVDPLGLEAADDTPLPSCVNFYTPYPVTGNPIAGVDPPYGALPNYPWGKHHLQTGTLGEAKMDTKIECICVENKKDCTYSVKCDVTLDQFIFIDPSQTFEHPVQEVYGHEQRHCFYNAYSIRSACLNIGSDEYDDSIINYGDGNKELARLECESKASSIATAISTAVFNLALEDPHGLNTPYNNALIIPGKPAAGTCYPPIGTVPGPTLPPPNIPRPGGPLPGRGDTR